jgi:hypothetical protein
LRMRLILDGRGTIGFLRNCNLIGAFQSYFILFVSFVL